MLHAGISMAIKQEKRSFPYLAILIAASLLFFA